MRKCANGNGSRYAALGHVDKDKDILSATEHVILTRTFEQQLGSQISTDIAIEGGTKRNLTFDMHR